MRVARREVVRVKVVGNDLGAHAQETLHTLDRALVALVGREVVEIPDVGAEVGAVACSEAERVLQLRTARQSRAARAAARAGSDPARSRASGG